MFLHSDSIILVLRSMKLHNVNSGDDDDDDDDDDDCFCGMVDRRKAFNLFLQSGPLSAVLTISNLRHAASRI